MALDNNANWIKCGFSSSSSLFKLLIKASISAKHEIISAKQANIGFVKIKSQADGLPHWSPSNLELHFQLRHVLKLLSA